MATRWHWDDLDQGVWIIQRTRQAGLTSEDRILLTKEQIAKLAKDIKIKDEGSL